MKAETRKISNRTNNKVLIINKINKTKIKNSKTNSPAMRKTKLSKSKTSNSKTKVMVKTKKTKANKKLIKTATMIMAASLNKIMSKMMPHKTKTANHEMSHNLWEKKKPTKVTRTLNKARLCSKVMKTKNMMSRFRPVLSNIAKFPRIPEVCCELLSTRNIKEIVITANR